MFELTLSINLEKQKYLLDFKKNLTSELGENFATIIFHNENGRCNLAVACDESKKEYIKAKILSGILEIIVSAYKFEYFKEYFQQFSNNYMLLPFLKAISIFDQDCDLEVIKTNICLSSEILIDSFFAFRLQSLKNRWQKTAEAIQKNNIISSETALKEVIKYLSSTGENFLLVANIEISENRLVIDSFKGKKKFSSKDSGISRFLTELISLNPLKINITQNYELDKPCKVCDILNDIFGEKIYLQS